MSTRGWVPKTVDNPRGAWTAVSLVRKGNPARATEASNVRFSPGQVYSREGTTAVQAVTGKVSAIYNWLAPTQNLVLYQEGTAVKRKRLSDNQIDTLLSSLGGAYAPSFADLGSRVYFCGYDTSGNGTYQCRVHDGNFTSGVPNVDVAFRGPLTVTSMTATDGGTGRCTKGTHKVAFVFQSRSGFSGQPSPVVGATFTPASVTLNAGLRTISLTISLTTPSDAGTGSALYPIMTRADNPDKWYFVPDGFYSPSPMVLPASASWTQTITISISDEDLADSGNPVDDYFNRLVAGASSGPFNPNFVCAYGKRMVYGAGTKVYISDIDDPQAISEDLHTQQLPSQRQIGAAFQLGTGLYLTGDKWTGRLSDNGDLPSTWAQPEMVSDALGAPFPECVEAKTAGAYVWIAAEAGLYVFNGSFPNRPITYLWSDIWAAINWKAAYAIKVKDDPVNLKCYVAVPLGTQTVCSRVFVVDYTNGLTYDTCDISMDDYHGSDSFASIGLVKGYSNYRTSLWIGPSTTGNIAFLDPATHNDQGVAVHSRWTSGYVRQGGELMSGTVRVGNAQLWIRGNGTLIHTWKGLDATPVVTPVVMGNGSVVTTLSALPGIELHAKGDLCPVENFTLNFEVNEVNGWFSLSGFRAYSRPSLYNR